MELANNKSGANVVIDEIKVKASISDSTSLQKLEVQWGPFQPRTGDIQVAVFTNRLMHPSDPERGIYHSAKRAFTASLTEMLGEVHQAERRYNSSAPYRDCDPVKLMRSSFPSFEDWKAGSAIPDFTGIFSGASRACGFAVNEPSRPRLQQFAGYEACPTGNGIAYRKVRDLYNRPAVFDAGKRVYVNDASDDSIIVALRLMSERYPDLLLQPFGPPDFLARVEKLAHDEGIPLLIGRENRHVVLNAKDDSDVVPLTATDIALNQKQAIQEEPTPDIPVRTSVPKTKEEIRRDAEQAAFNAAMANQQGR